MFTAAAAILDGPKSSVAAQFAGSFSRRKPVSFY
jgi:hypothetical protein